jgi:membrane protein
LLWRLWNRILDDDIFGYSAQLSYYFFFALFPLLLILITVLGFFADQGSQLRHDLLGYLIRVMPSSASVLVVQTVNEISDSAGSGKISIGILAALWAASNGIGAMITGLNGAYRVKETRPWWKVRLISLALTITLSILVLIGLTLFFYGGGIASSIAAKHGYGDAFTVGWHLVQWPLIFFVVLLFFSAIYFFAPSPHGQRWQIINPGALIGIILWLLVSFGFRIYLHYFNSYGRTYGSLGAVIILLLWFYVMGAAILIGGEINSELVERKRYRAKDEKPEGAEPPPDDATEPNECKTSK